MTRYEQMKQIIEKHQAEEVEGKLIDVQTAQAYIAIHDGFKKEENRTKLDSMDLYTACKVCWQIIGK